MITLSVGNSYSQLRGLDSSQMAKLRKILSYNTDPSAAFFAGGNYPRVRYLIDIKGNFPTGLLNKVYNFLSSNQLKYVTDKKPSAPPLNKVDHKATFRQTPWAAQESAARKALIYQRGTIQMPTGTGKSLVIALIASRLGVRTLIVVPTLQIKEQLRAMFKTIFADMSNITIENIDSSALKKAKDYECLIIDEAHHVAAKTYQKLNKAVWAGIYYRFFLTATPFRNNTEENILMESVAGQIFYELSYKQAVWLKYIVPIEAYYIELPKVKTDAFTWAQVYSELVVNNVYRNETIARLLCNLQASQIPTLCLVKEIKHGNALGQISLVDFANGQDESSRIFIERFNTGKIKALVGTNGILGEGVDTKPCEYVIVAGLGKAKSAFMQQVGRAIRSYPGKQSAKVILLKDRSHKFTLKHFNEQCKILKEEYGVIPAKLED